jgi:hypothetical protein
MDIVSILIVAGIVILCLVPLLFRSSRILDKSKDDIEVRDAGVARELRESRNQIDRRSRDFGGRF